MSEPLRFVDACTEEHFSAMSAIHCHGWRTTYRGFVPDDYLRDVTTEDHWIPFFREDRATGRCRGLLLYEQDRPVACCNYGPIRSGPSPRQSEGLVIDSSQYQGWGEVISFYTESGCTGMGYGSVLLEEALRRLKTAGYPGCTLFVLRENEGARRFYQRHGFAWDGTVQLVPFPHDMVCHDLRYIHTF
ncbi:GNAT family N-acetyltransferase [Flavonifractor hominis]|uniref:GNAT family N-acetyltransferase n=1 Tax=Flavonifractor hominis TaxID=3133178 RepID=A0ABV1ELY7_9FIRM